MLSAWADICPSWTLHLRAERKSEQTVKSYTAGVRQLLDWCTARGVPAVLDRPTVNAFVADLLDSGAEAATARARQLGVRRFSRGWPRKARPTATSCSASSPRSSTRRSCPA